MTRELRLGTRGSLLALWQANAVAARIAEHGGPPCRIVTIKTTGDRLQDAPLSEAGGKRLFVKEIEDALLRDQIDLAVHSSKDLPVVLPDGLTIAAVLPREDPLDAVVLPRTAAGAAVTSVEQLVASLGQTPSIGTGSVRRIAQLARLFPNARFEPIRGNLDTRLRKLDDGSNDALILAAAGLRRLGFTDRISMTLPAAVCVPAPGQGIVAIEIRRDDERVRAAVEPIGDAAAGAALAAERAAVVVLGGGCQTPIGALAVPMNDGTSGAATELDMIACVVAIDGSRAVRAEGRGSMHEAAALGERIGAQLIQDGAADILEQAQHASHDRQGD
ncbi:MAG TPA: hydroxymethylbilane synthase [Vicinamibacterales bacterium]